MNLDNRTAVVTGSGRGIGRALALEFARHKTRVVCCARTNSAINETVDMIRAEGGTALGFQADVTDSAQVEALVEKTLKEWGQIDILFNNAGAFRAIGGLWEVDPEVWWNDVTINLRGLMLCCHAVLPHMLGRNEGIIINMNGGGAGDAIAGGSAYSCSKAAVMRFTDGLAKELSRIDSSVIVVGMGPGFVPTAMTALQAYTDEGKKWFPGATEKYEKGPHRVPEDCAQATMQLVGVLTPNLSGRNFSTGMDFKAISEQVKSINENDLYTLRFRSGN